MNQAVRHNTTVSVESRVPASALFQQLRDILRIDSSIEAAEYATELYFTQDDSFPVRVAMEFGEDDGRSPLFEDDDDDGYVNPHTPYAEISLSTDSGFVSKLQGDAKDLHAAILVELSDWFDDHGIDWGYYSDADTSGRWISGEFPKRFGNPEKVDLDEIALASR